MCKITAYAAVAACYFFDGKIKWLIYSFIISAISATSYVWLKFDPLEQMEITSGMYLKYLSVSFLLLNLVMASALIIVAVTVIISDSDEDNMSDIDPA